MYCEKGLRLFNKVIRKLESCVFCFFFSVQPVFDRFYHHIKSRLKHQLGQLLFCFFKIPSNVKKDIETEMRKINTLMSNGELLSSRLYVFSALLFL